MTSKQNDYVSQMESMFRHLDSVIGEHLKALDTALNKGGKVKPVMHKTRILQSGGSSALENQLFRALGSLGGSALNGDSRLLSGTGAFRASQGQVWADAASTLSRAMKRYL